VDPESSCADWLVDGRSDLGDMLYYAMQSFASSHVNSLWINGGPNNQVVKDEVFIAEVCLPFQYLTNLRAFEVGVPM
jgi:hypothetical protein